MLDAARLRSGGESRAQELQKLRQAVQVWGFFELRNHSVDAAARHDLLTAQRAFFELPMRDKLQLARTSENARGFNAGELTQNQVDAKEILDLGYKPDPKAADNAPINRVADGWNQLPEVSSIREPLWRWFCVCEPLAIEIYGWLLEAMGATPDLDALRRQHTSFLRLNAYSDARGRNPVKPNRQPATAPLGIHPHTDAGLLTLLVQNGANALEVRRQNRWHLIEPTDNTFIVNTGDMLQVLSNDQFIAPQHRVLGTVGTETRFSAAYFLNPPVDQLIKPLAPEDKNASAEDPRYRAFTWGDFRGQRAAGDYEDLGEEVQISHYRI